MAPVPTVEKEGEGNEKIRQIELVSAGIVREEEGLSTATMTNIHCSLRIHRSPEQVKVR